MELWGDYINNQGKHLSKWTWYIPAYERHFSKLKNQSNTFLEIGVWRGGSLELWRNYFGPLTKVVGIDIDSNCAHLTTQGTSIRIGSQSDTTFLQSIVDEFGVPDIILDDGSHQTSDIIASFDFFYPLMPKNGVYMIEDVHANRDTAEQSVVLNHILQNQGWNNTFAISLYDSMICIEKCEYGWKENVARP
jgi:hypothetical protein